MELEESFKKWHENLELIADSSFLRYWCVGENINEMKIKLYIVC
jgi:hypothetical protein